MHQVSGIASRYLDNKQWLFNQNVLFHVLVSGETDKDSKIPLKELYQPTLENE